MQITDDLTIPEDELQWSFARSSGPGGQNVNKVNSKATLKWTVRANETLPEAVRERFLLQQANRINNEGDLVIQSEESRDQPRNVELCREKLRSMIVAASIEPVRRRKTRPSRAARTRRLENKRQHSQKKQARSNRWS